MILKKKNYHQTSLHSVRKFNGDVVAESRPPGNQREQLSRKLAVSRPVAIRFTVAASFQPSPNNELGYSPIHHIRGITKIRTRVKCKPR